MKSSNTLNKEEFYNSNLTIRCLPIMDVWIIRLSTGMIKTQRYHCFGKKVHRRSYYMIMSEHALYNSKWEYSILKRSSLSFQAVL